MQKGKFTKHYFEGSSRVVSKLGEGTFSHKNTGIMAGGIDYLKRTQKEQAIRDLYIKGSLTPPGPPTQQGIYTTPEWTGQPYPSIDWESISQNQEPPQGWPRYPKFNPVGDVPGPPVQFGEPITNTNVKAGYGFIPNGVEEKNLYFYHPDHLGSSSYITDKNGEVIQHTEYIAFGETFVDEHSVSNKQPYLFNGKELDYETGLYYYGARYYDPKTSIFLNVDPLVEKTGTPYAYTYNNPIRFIDPTGMKPDDWYESKNSGKIVWFDGDKKREGYNHLGSSVHRRYLHYAADGNVYDDSPKGLGRIDNSKKVYGIEEITLLGKRKVNYSEHLGTGLFYADIALTSAELKGGSFRLSTTKQGFSPKYYGNNWRGNQYTQTHNIGKIAKIGGYITFGIGTISDISGVYEYTENANSSKAIHPIKGSINIGVGAYGIFGGIPGATVGLIYSIIDNFYPGGWAQAMEDNYRREKEIQKIVPDFKLFPKPAY